MKLYTFEVAGERRSGAECNGQLIDLATSYAALTQARGLKAGAPPALPPDMLALLGGGESTMQAARDTLAFMAKRPATPVGQRLSYPFDAVRIAAPLPRPGKILCSG